MPGALGSGPWPASRLLGSAQSVTFRQLVNGSKAKQKGPGSLTIFLRPCSLWEMGYICLCSRLSPLRGWLLSWTSRLCAPGSPRAGGQCHISVASPFPPRKGSSRPGAAQDPEHVLLFTINTEAPSVQPDRRQGLRWVSFFSSFVFFYL